MKAKQPTRTIRELVDVACTVAQYAGDQLIDNLADDRWVFPGDGPPDPDTTRPRTVHFDEKHGYTFVWYEIFQQTIIDQIKDTIEQALDRQAEA